MNADKSSKLALQLFFMLVAIVFVAGCSTTIAPPKASIAPPKPSIAPPRVKSTLSPGFMRIKYERVAVYVNNNRNNSLRNIEEEFVRALIRKKYVVPARSDLGLVLKEQAFQVAGITEKAAISLGKLIDVQAIIIVNVDQRERNISARMVDVESGEIVWIGKSESGPFYYAEARCLARMIPTAEDPSEVFKTDWDYYRAGGSYSITFNPRYVDRIIVQIEGLDRERTRRLEDEVIAKLMENGYRVPSRSDIEAIIKEHNFNVNMLSDTALVQLGRLSNTKYMIVVWMSPINKLHNRAAGFRYEYGCNCAVRIIDLEKSNIVWSGTLFETGWLGRGDKVEELYDHATKRLVESGLIPNRKEMVKDAVEP